MATVGVSEGKLVSSSRKKKSQDAESGLIAPMDSYTACRSSQGPSPRCRDYVDPPLLQVVSGFDRCSQPLLLVTEDLCPLASRSGACPLSCTEI